jgi:hypothetical protein
LVRSECQDSAGRGLANASRAAGIGAFLAEILLDFVAESLVMLAGKMHDFDLKGEVHLISF